MEALNYTQLASVVLVLSVASLLLFVISLILAVIIRRNHNRSASCFITQDTIIGGLQSLINNNTKMLIDKIEIVDSLLSINKKNIYDHVEARIKVLTKPAYAMGDKVETIDGIKGTITDISRDEDGFMYEIT